MSYALWALKNNLHILMDKPISTYENVANSIEQARQIKQDYNFLVENYTGKTAFIINAQRRFLPQFEIVQTKVGEIAKKYGIPVTSIQTTHSDGQWRLPNEVLSIKYHPSLGWGKVSHSGYHFIDMVGKILRDSFVEAGKQFDQVSVFSRFICASGILKQQSQDDLVKLFGRKYIALDSRSDEELMCLYKKNNEAEIDAMSLITFYDKNIPVSIVTLNLIHNGFSCRSWLMPNMDDLYKGNGRVRHEYHNIQQGPIQNIQIHSYQSRDKHDQNTEDDFLIGGNNHYDIYIFKNSDLVGGKRLEIITAEDIAKEYSQNSTKNMNELARYEAVKEFLSVLIGKKEALNTKGNLLDNEMSSLLMSMIYESGICNNEISQPYKPTFF